MDRTQRSSSPTDRPGYGFTMYNSDTVKSTKAGTNADTNGHQVIHDLVGNVKGRDGGVFSASVAAGVSVNTSTSELATYSVTLPANILRAGTMVRISGMVTAPTTNSTDTLIIRVRIGPTTLTGTAVLTGAAIDVANGSFAVFNTVLTVRADPSATSAIVGSSQLSNFGTTSAGVAAVPQTLAATNFATNGALLVEVTLQWSVSSASDIAIGDYLNIEIY